MKIIWTEPAVADLQGIRDYIARDSEFYALQFTGRIIAAVETLESFPERGRKVPESLRADDAGGIRELLFQSYRIVYRLKGEGVQILAILHGSRNLGQMTLKPWEVG